MIILIKEKADLKNMKQGKRGCKKRGEEMTTNRSRAGSTAIKKGIAALLCLAGFAGAAHATEGMFQHAYGLRHKALAGAGAASIEDATGISINPAGLVDVDSQFNMGLSVFMPFRQYTASGTAMIDVGTHKSTGNVWPAPTLAYVRKLDDHSAFAFSIFGNGGMNTTYKAFARTNGCPPGTPGTGAFCFGKAGVDLMQMFISAGYARKLSDNFSIGIAPILAIQRFKAYGLGNGGAGFSGMSAYPGNFSGVGYDWSAGGGVRVGFLWHITDTFSFGASYQTKMWMSKLDKYRGLFAEQGNLDIPANMQIGVAWQATDSLKLMLDYRRLFFDGVKAIGRSSVFAGTPFGSDGGPGFGWRDTSTIKIGLEYQLSNDLILRAGYAHIWPNPVPSSDTAINIISPGVIRHEFTGGATWRYNAHHDIDVAFMIAPKGKQEGAVPAIYGGGRSKLEMYQFEVALGWTYNFGAGSTRAR